MKPLFYVDSLGFPTATTIDIKSLSVMTFRFFSAYRFLEDAPESHTLAPTRLTMHNLLDASLSPPQPDYGKCIEGQPKKRCHRRD